MLQQFVGASEQLQLAAAGGAAELGEDQPYQSLDLTQFRRTAGGSQLELF